MRLTVLERIGGFHGLSKGTLDRLAGRRVHSRLRQNQPAPREDLDHFILEKLENLIPRLKMVNPKLEIAVAGNISEENKAKCAPYYAEQR
jgi:hypothetical protein